MTQPGQPTSQPAFAAAFHRARAFPSVGAEPGRTARLVHSLSKLRLRVDPCHPLVLTVRVEGEVATLGWSDFRLDRRIYLNPPLDGIFEADLIGMRPGGGVADVRTPFAFETSWPGFPRGRLRGLRVRSATNSLTAMLI